MKPNRLKLLLAPAAAVLVGVCIVISTAFGFGGSDTATAAETIGGTGVICSGGGQVSYTNSTGQTVALTPAQISNAAEMVQAGKALNAPDEALVLDLMAALQESTIRNLANSNVPDSLNYPHDAVGSDHKSVGTLQEQVDMGWGTLDQLMQPSWQSTQFLTRLLRLPGWQTMSPTNAIQAIQHSAAGDAYQRWESPAEQILGSIQGVTCNNGDDAGPGGRQSVVRAALSQKGVPYAWDGGDLHGPTRGLCVAGAASNDCNVIGFDCSGLVLYAYGTTGLVLPHDAARQYLSGPHPDRSQLQPGDLLFLSTDLNDPTLIHHVVIWIGNNSIIQAPESGEKVDVVKNPFAQSWFSSEYIGATRPSIPEGSK